MLCLLRSFFSCDTFLSHLIWRIHFTDGKLTWTGNSSGMNPVKDQFPVSNLSVNVSVQTDWKIGRYLGRKTVLNSYQTLACSRLRDSGEKSFSKKKCEKRVGAGERQGVATAPFPKLRASYFRFARFNTYPPYYLRAWHRLIRRENQDDVFELALKEKTGTSKLATVSG